MASIDHFRAFTFGTVAAQYDRWPLWLRSPPSHESGPNRVPEPTPVELVETPEGHRCFG